MDTGLNEEDAPDGLGANILVFLLSHVTSVMAVLPVFPTRKR